MLPLELSPNLSYSSAKVKRDRKRGGVQQSISMGLKDPWKIGVLLCHLVTSRPLIFLQKEAVLSPCDFATTHSRAFILHFSETPVCSYFWFFALFWRVWSKFWLSVRSWESTLLVGGGG